VIVPWRVLEFAGEILLMVKKSQTNIWDGAERLLKMGYSPDKLVQDSFHQHAYTAKRLYIHTQKLKEELPHLNI